MDTKPPGLIYARIAACMAEVSAVGKTGRNTGQSYDFRKIDDAYDAFQPVLSRNKVFIAPTIMEHTREQRTTSKGGFVMTTLTKVRYKIFTEDGSFIEADALGEGADSGDKSANKASSCALKDLMLKVFCVRVKGNEQDSEMDSHEYQPQRPSPKIDLDALEAAVAPPEHEQPQTPIPAPKPSPATRGELMGRLLTVLAPTVELQNILVRYLRSVPTPKGELVLGPQQDIADIPTPVLAALSSRWPEAMAKIEAWTAGNQPDGPFRDMHAAVENPPLKLDWRVAVLPYVPADPTKTHLAGLTLQKLFDADSKWAFRVAMNYKAPDADATEADRHFEDCCKQWRKEKGK